RVGCELKLAADFWTMRAVFYSNSDIYFVVVRCHINLDALVILTRMQRVLDELVIMWCFYHMINMINFSWRSLLDSCYGRGSAFCPGHPV
ncbi:MAG: hypothetical protein ACK559_30515, partial [bacterium]